MMRLRIQLQLEPIIEGAFHKRYFLAQGASNLVPQAPRHAVATVGYSF